MRVSWFNLSGNITLNIESNFLQRKNYIIDFLQAGWMEQKKPENVVLLQG